LLVFDLVVIDDLAPVEGLLGRAVALRFVAVSAGRLVMKTGLMDSAQPRVHAIDSQVLVASAACGPLLLVVPVVAVEVRCLLLQQVLGVPESQSLVLGISSHDSFVEDVVELIEGSKLPLLLAREHHQGWVQDVVS